MGSVETTNVLFDDPPEMAELLCGDDHTPVEVEYHGLCRITEDGFPVGLRRLPVRNM